MTAPSKPFLLFGILPLFFLWSCKSLQNNKSGPPVSSEYPIKVNEHGDFSDLKVFDHILKNKRLVLLGEFTHGAKEINLLKNRLIKYLHEKLGYDLLLLESGIGEGMAIHFDRQELSTRQMVTAGITGPWHTFDYLDFMQYLKGRPELIYGGIDVQRTGRSFGKLLRKVLPATQLDTSQFNHIEAEFGDMLRQLRSRKVMADEQLLKEKERLVNQYQSLQQAFLANNEELKAKIGKEKTALILQTFTNRIEFLNYYTAFKQDNDYRKRWAARDSLMAANTLWFINQLHPDKKVIISAHNFHIDKANEKELTMGEILAEQLGDQIYAIGLFGGQGSYANNSRKEEALTFSEEENDIQKIIVRSVEEASFFPIPPASDTSLPWLYEELTVNHSFINLENDRNLHLSKAFDGIIGIRNISPPQYIN